MNCVCGSEIIGNSSCGYICSCGQRWWWNFEINQYEQQPTNPVEQNVSKQPLCYAIIDKDGKMYFDEICVCEDEDPMQEICSEMDEDDPERKYRVVGLIAC